MFKVIGMIMIVFSTSLMGYLKASTYKKRVAEITEFQKAFELFETEVRFTKTPLCTAFYKISGSVSGNISEIFKKFSDEYSMPIGKSANELWDKILEDYKVNLNLNADDVKIIKDFGVCLGTFDTEGQIDSVTSVRKRLLSQQDNAIEACDKSTKLYQSLGVYSGILVAILLF